MGASIEFVSMCLDSGTMRWKIGTVLWLGLRIRLRLTGYIAVLMGRSSHRARLIIVDLIFFVIVLVARMIGLLNRLLTYTFLDFSG